MANINHTAAASRVFNFSAHGLFARIHDWNDARRTRAALSRLSMQELDDIGLVPGDIDRIAKRGF